MIKPMCVYLAGPIDGRDGHEVHGWRSEVILQAPSGVLLFNPATAYGNVGHATAPALDFTNRGVIANCSGVLANLSLGITIGTIREVEFAVQMGKPIVAVVEREDISESLMYHDLVVAHTVASALEMLVEAIQQGRQQQHPLHFLLRGAPPQQEDDDT